MNEDLRKENELLNILIENKLAKVEDEKILLSNEAVIIITIVIAKLTEQILKKLLKKE